MGSSKTLVTGFGAFGQITENPSAKLAETCGRTHQILEVSFQAVDEFLAGLDPNSFDIFLPMGVAAGRTQLCLELFGRNWIGRAKDVRGCGEEGFIEEGAPTLLQATLWTPEVSSEIVAYDNHVRISMDAGDYLCNYITYRALQRFPDKRVGFLHVPGEKNLGLDIQASSLKRILESIEK